MQEQRIWCYRCVKQGASATGPLHIWDGGGEIWELVGSEVRHYRVIARTFLNKEMTRMKEILERMEESAIPKEIYAKHSRKDMKWELESADAEETELLVPAVWELTSLAPWIPHNVLLTTPSFLPVAGGSRCDLSTG
jgi:hypothetical protein